MHIGIIWFLQLLYSPHFHCLISMVRMSATMLNKGGESILFLILEELFSFSSWCLTLVIGLPYRNFVVFVFSMIFIFLVSPFMKGYRMLSRILFVSIDDHVYVLEPIHELHCIYWLEFAKLSLSQNNLATLFYFLNVLLSSFCNYFI